MVYNDLYNKCVELLRVKIDSAILSDEKKKEHIPAQAVQLKERYDKNGIYSLDRKGTDFKYASSLADLLDKVVEECLKSVDLNGIIDLITEDTGILYSNPYIYTEYNNPEPVNLCDYSAFDVILFCIGDKLFLDLIDRELPNYFVLDKWI